MSHCKCHEYQPSRKMHHSAKKMSLPRSMQIQTKKQRQPAQVQNKYAAPCTIEVCSLPPHFMQPKETDVHPSFWVRSSSAEGSGWYVHNLAGIHDPVRIKSLLDALHNAEGVNSDFCQQSLLLAYADSMFTLASSQQIFISTINEDIPCRFLPWTRLSQPCG